MSFKEVATLDADKVIALGGVDKQNKNKPNPKSAEGYYLGSRKVESKKAKSGYSYIHYLQTETGNLGVWGKTDLDRKLLSVSPGTMVRINQTGTRPTPNGPMYVYKVEVDSENIIDVGDLANEGTGTSSEETEDQYESEEEAQEESEDELPARAASASKQSEVSAILKRRSATR